LSAGTSDGWYLLPGTHSKWVRLHDARIEWMRTYLSGELFGLLRERGTLASIMRSGEADLTEQSAQAAFERGVAAASNGALSNALFAARAQVVTGGLAAALGATFVSGTLFGAEWRDMAALLGQARTVRAIGDARLCALHARCAALHGVALEILDIADVQRTAWMHLRTGEPSR